MEEVVLRDTLILGERYGVVQSFGAIRFMRSTDTDIYEYIPIRKRDTVLYHYGQSCATPASMYWLYIPDFCSLSGTSSNSIQYAKYSLAPTIFVGISSYNGEFIEYEKPFGLVSYSAKECHPVYSPPNHITRPMQYQDPGGWYQSCSGSDKIKLLSASIQGKMRLNLNIDNNSILHPVSLGGNAGMALSLPYSERFISVLPDQLILQISLDTIYSDIPEIRLYGVNQTLPIQRVATTGSSVTLSTTLPKGLGTLSFRSKSLDQRDQEISIKLSSTTSNVEFLEATTFIRHQGRPIYNLSVNNGSASQEANFGDSVKLALRLPYSESLIALLPDELSLQLSFDTNYLESPTIRPFGTNQDLSFQRVVTTGSTVIATVAVPKKLGMLVFRSKSLQPQEQQISIQLSTASPNFLFPQATTLIRHKGRLIYNLSVNNDSASQEVNFGGSVKLALRLPYSESLVALLPDELSLQLSFDTNHVEIPIIRSFGTNQDLSLQRVATTGSTVTLTAIVPKKLGTVIFRSKSLQPREQQISMQLSTASPKFLFPEAMCLVRHQGLSAYNLSQDAQSKVAAGQNIIQHIAPNPSSDNVSVRYAMGASAEVISVEIVNALGIPVKSLSLPSYTYGVHDIAIDISDLTQGIYFLKVQSNSNVEMRKIIVGR
jgi:hypothetical protein